MAEATGSVTDGLVGLVNVFVDPQTTAQKVPSRLSWVWPVVVLVIGYTVLSYLMTPYTMEMVDASIAQRNLPPEQLEQAKSVGRTVGQVISYVAPILGIAFIALFALLIKVVYSMMDIRPKFREVFAMLAACSVIPFLQAAATYVVLRIKGDPIESPEQLQPPFGLDIFMQGIHGATFAFVHFFSIFQIWYLVVLVFGLAYLTKSTRMQALFAITPVWLIPLGLAMIGAMFQKSPA
jgi:VanZ family protein